MIYHGNVAVLNNESFAISSQTTGTEKILHKTTVHHSINLSESMNLSSPEEKRILELLVLVQKIILN